jgi:hypothetical protein
MCSSPPSDELTASIVRYKFHEPLSRLATMQIEKNFWPWWWYFIHTLELSGTVFLSGRPKFVVNT